MGESEPAGQAVEMRLPAVEQLEGAFLHTAEDLQPVDAIDLSPITQPRSGPDASSTNVTGVALFISEHAEGAIDQSSLNDLFSKTVTTSYDVDELFDVISTIEDQHPRVMELLERVRDTNMFDSETYVEVAKATWVMTAYRHLDRR